ncbi:MAG: DUF1292 domain-containing protein [Firmicutes bacterium]|nr:DUF1292 domain-containing protein [Bacillota bacterium]
MSDEINNRLIELTDEETGEKVTFEHLDSIIYGDDNYLVLTEYDENEQPESEKEYDVYVMKLVVEENGEEALEVVEDDDVINNVFNEFKAHAEDEFEFLD